MAYNTTEHNPFISMSYMYMCCENKAERQVMCKPTHKTSEIVEFKLRAFPQCDWLMFCRP